MSKKKKRADEESSPAAAPVNTSAEPGWPAWGWKIAIALIVVILFGRATGYPYLIPGEASRLLSTPQITTPDWAAAFSATWEWQPLAWLSSMADFALFGPQADAQRAVNLLLHLANALLAFSVWRKLTQATLNSAIAALLFAIHPLRVEPVIWLIERRTLLATLFALLAMRAYAEFVEGDKKWRIAVFICTLLAALSHPVGAIVPLLLLLLDTWPLGRTENLGARLAEKAELALISLATIAMSVRGATGTEALWTNGIFDAGTRLGHSFCGLGVALLRTLLPFPLDQYNTLEPPLWAAVITVAALGAMVFTRSAALRTGLAWFFLAMIPTLGLVHAEIAPWRDSGTYLAHLGLLAGLVWLAARANRERLTAIALMLGIVWFGLAWLRIGEWGVGENLLRASVERGGHPLAHYQLGQLLLQTRRVAESEKHLRAVLAVRPTHLDAKLLLANVLLQTKRPAEGVAQLEEAIRLAPDRPDAYFALGFLQTTTGQAEAGARTFAAALKRGLTPEQEAQAENAIGVFHLNQKRYAEALPHLERACERAPTYASAQANRARALMGLGQTRRAFAYLERARLYTKEANEVVDAWTEVFNQLGIEEKKKDVPPGKK